MTMSCMDHILNSRYCAKCTPFHISLTHQPGKEGAFSAEMGSESSGNRLEVGRFNSAGTDTKGHSAQSPLMILPRSQFKSMKSGFHLIGKWGPLTTMELRIDTIKLVNVSEKHCF